METATGWNKRKALASQFDASERKKHEAEAAALRENLESLVKSRTLELETALQRSQFLLQEVDHRVKNNLQMISAMLMLQSMTIADETAKRTLQEMLERVDAMGLVHKRLYQSGDVVEFDIGDFARDIISHLMSASGRRTIDLELDIASVKVKASDAASLALVINEAVTTALKRDRTDPAHESLFVGVSQIDDAVAIIIRDSGANSDAPWIASAFGKTLVEALVRQLHATIEWTAAATGAELRITMPLVGTKPPPTNG